MMFGQLSPQIGLLWMAKVKRIIQTSRATEDQLRGKSDSRKVGGGRRAMARAGPSRHWYIHVHLRGAWTPSLASWQPSLSHPEGGGRSEPKQPGTLGLLATGALCPPQPSCWSPQWVLPVSPTLPHTVLSTPTPFSFHACWLRAPPSAPSAANLSCRRLQHSHCLGHLSGAVCSADPSEESQEPPQGGHPIPPLVLPLYLPMHSSHLM